MSEQTKYPKRGHMSEDGKVYTDCKGGVHERVADMKQSNLLMCPGACSLLAVDDFYPRDHNEESICRWTLIEGAYVPSDCELEACEMARAMIEQCVFSGGDCSDCGAFTDQNCPARVYLAAHGDAQAWEVVG